MALRDFTDDFPILKKLNYLNAASIGPVPKPVIDFSTGFDADIAGGGTKTLSEEKEDMVYDGLRLWGSRLLGCRSDDVAAFNSVSEAMNCITWSLGITEGKLVSTNIEFPSVTYPALRLAQMENAVSVKLVEAVDWYLPVDDILDEIDGSTRAVFITHVENLTGQRHDINRITKHAHEQGALVIVDGIQAAGCIPINVVRSGVDVYITGSYKYLCAPFGAAIAYVSKPLCDRLDPVIVGWRTSDVIWDFNAEKITYPATARKFEYSTSAYGVKLGLAESIKYLLGFGIEDIYSHNTGLVKLLQEGLQAIKGLEPVTPEEHGSIYTFTVKGLESNAVSKELKSMERPIELSIRQGLIRVSPHLYNNERDILEFVEAMKRVTKQD
jgi:cysteine desulfurase/selenocysteine lyase